jgi:hypothetical protein
MLVLTPRLRAQRYGVIPRRFSLAPAWKRRKARTPLGGLSSLYILPPPPWGRGAGVRGSVLLSRNQRSERMGEIGDPLTRPASR